MSVRGLKKKGMVSAPKNGFVDPQVQAREVEGNDPVAGAQRADPATSRAAREAQAANEATARARLGPIAALGSRRGMMSPEEAQLRDDLAELGYPVGGNVKDAIKQFQKDNGLKQTGDMDPEMLMAMVDALLKQRGARPMTPPRKSSPWSSGQPGGTPGTQNGPTSPNGFSSPTGDFSKAAGATPSDKGVSNGPAPKGKVNLATQEGKDVFRQAAKAAGLPESWADSPALRSLVNAESGGIVGRLNYTYGKRDMEQAHAELKSGRISTRSSATGLGQLLLQNVDRYYPNGRAGIGDPVQEAAGMMKYIKDRYGSPEVAWGNHSANRNRYQGVPRIYRGEGY